MNRHHDEILPFTQHLNPEWNGLELSDLGTTCLISEEISGLLSLETNALDEVAAVDD